MKLSSIIAIYWEVKEKNIEFFDFNSNRLKEKLRQSYKSHKNRRCIVSKFVNKMHKQEVIHYGGRSLSTNAKDKCSVFNEFSIRLADTVKAEREDFLMAETVVEFLRKLCLRTFFYLINLPKKIFRNTRTWVQSLFCTKVRLA